MHASDIKPSKKIYDRLAGKAQRSVYKAFKNSVVIFMHAFRSFLKSLLSIASNAAIMTFDRLLILSINTSRCFSKKGAASEVNSPSGSRSMTMHRSKRSLAVASWPRWCILSR